MKVPGVPDWGRMTSLMERITVALERTAEAVEEAVNIFAELVQEERNRADQDGRPEPLHVDPPVFDR